MDITHSSSSEHVVIAHVSVSQPFQWLRLGWQDLRRAPRDSLFYGAVFVVMGFLLNMYFDFAPEYVITLAALFLLAGPYLAIGLYDIARQLELDGKRVNLWHSMTAWRANMPGFTLFAALLAVIVFGWFRVSLLMFALFYEGSVPSLAALLSSVWTMAHSAFLVAYFGSGFFFAVAVFALSVCAIPMMLHKDVDTITAMVNSVQAVYHNLLTMLVWAAMIVALTAIGFATHFIALLLIMPLIGLASWHAYRALIHYE